jgi:hypothetical protein
VPRAFFPVVPFYSEERIFWNGLRLSNVSILEFLKTSNLDVFFFARSFKLGLFSMLNYGRVLVAL